VNLTLPAMGKKYGTDKENGHDFLRYYDGIFAETKNSVRRVLEIGVLAGASLKMWRDYFPNAVIFGADTDKRVLSDLGPRIQTVQADQSKPEDLDKLAAFGPFDVIIDDGSHMCRHQQLTFGKLFKNLNTNGVFIIEDLHTSMVPRYINDAEITTLDMLYKLMQTGIIHSADIVAADQSFINQNVRATMILTSRFRRLNSITGVVQRKPVVVG
jgi:trans-aconitate methyltransferase